MDTLQSQVDALRAQIIALHAEREAIQATALSSTEAARAIDRMIESNAARAEERLARMAAIAFRTGKMPSNFAPGADGAEAARAAFDLACLTNPKAIRTAMATGITEKDDVPAADKRARLVKIAQELDEIEMQEEAAIVASERTCDPILRRPDARAEIIAARQ